VQIISPIPEMLDRPNISGDMSNFWMQLAALSYATQELFLGFAGPYSKTLQYSDSAPLIDTSWKAGPPSFLETQVGSDTSVQFIWGDVVKGIEEMSHNATAALLTLQLGTTLAQCSFDKQIVAYQYSPFALWVPYGVSNFSLVSCYNLTFSLNFFIDSLGCWPNFTHCCHHDNGKK
jgi:hypothetical protein